MSSTIPEIVALYADVRRELLKLDALLSDPQPGVFTWHRLVNQQRETVMLMLVEGDTKMLERIAASHEAMAAIRCRCRGTGSIYTESECGSSASFQVCPECKGAHAFDRGPANRDDIRRRESA